MVDQFPGVSGTFKGGRRSSIAVQDQGYGEIHVNSLNAQDIAGPKEAGCLFYFPGRRSHFKGKIWEKLEILKRNLKRYRYYLMPSLQVIRDQESYNITGMIPGEEPEQMILLVCSYYDSYFTGFQDDNAAVAMMLGIARAFIQTGYRPRKTLVFCAMAEERMGVVDSQV